MRLSIYEIFIPKMLFYVSASRQALQMAELRI